MSKYTRKIIEYALVLLFIFVAAVINWFFPLTLRFGDTPLYRFVWLGIFFALLDLVFEVIQRAMKQMRLIGDMFGFGRDLKKIEKGFRVLSNAKLPNNAIIDYAVIGPSGVWFITTKDNRGKVSFNGDDLVQDNLILKGIITKSLEKSYALGELLKNKLNRDFKVAAVVAFMSSKIDLGDMPGMIRGVYITSRPKIKALIENTDVQILDSGVIEEIVKLLKK